MIFKYYFILLFLTLENEFLILENEFLILENHFPM